MNTKKIALACDHAGFELKEALKPWLDQKGYELVDCGTYSDASVDYPDFAHKLAELVESGQCERGISICGSGNGINITVNKHQGIRSALCWTEEISRLARSHNNANVCSLPARFISSELAFAIVDIFLNTPFEGGRHQTRIDKIPVKKA